MAVAFQIFLLHVGSIIPAPGDRKLLAVFSPRITTSGAGRLFDGQGGARRIIKQNNTVIIGLSLRAVAHHLRRTADQIQHNMERIKRVGIYGIPT